MKILGIIGIVILGFNLKLIDYGFSQLKGQLSLVHNARPISEVLTDPGVPDSIKQKLLLVNDIKQFAMDSLGMKATKNYTTYYDQHGKAILMVLSAAEKFRMKAYEWKFPIIGRVSYKGFFNFERGRVEKKELEEKGYDTDYSPTSAWSTLGWFRDPVFSGMLRRNEGQLAEVIIHEMTHGTIYLKSSVEFNENLASVIGEECAIRFIAYKFGRNSEEMMAYLHSKEDYDRFSEHMLRGAAMLESLYNTFEDSTPAQQKEKLKKAMIADIVLALDTIPFYEKEKYITLFWEKYVPNNAYFMAFKRYDEQKDEMRKTLNEKFGGDVRKYLESFREKNNKPSQ